MGSQGITKVIRIYSEWGVNICIIYIYIYMAIHPIVVGIFLNPRMLHRMLHRCCLSKTSLPSEWKKKICSFRNQCAVLPYCEGFCQGKKNKNKTTICYVCAHQEIAEIFYGQIHGTSYAKQCNDVGI